MATLEYTRKELRRYAARPKPTLTNTVMPVKVDTKSTATFRCAPWCFSTLARKNRPLFL